MAFDLVVRNCSEVVTARGDRASGAERALDIVASGAIGVSASRVQYVGPESGLPHDAVGPLTQVIDAGGNFVGPPFVDPHTHLVFAGERSGEFDLRCQGKSYVEIARAGGGIMSTVRATRSASEDDLVALALPRLRRLEQGVLYAEVKSGYGLELEAELKMLRVVRRLASEQPIELIPTLLCAHAVPEELKHARERYVDACVREILPAVAEAGMARGGR